MNNTLKSLRLGYLIVPVMIVMIVTIVSRVQGDSTDIEYLHQEIEIADAMLISGKGLIDYKYEIPDTTNSLFMSVNAQVHEKNQNTLGTTSYVNRKREINDMIIMFNGQKIRYEGKYQRNSLKNQLIELSHVKCYNGEKTDCIEKTRILPDGIAHTSGYIKSSCDIQRMNYDPSYYGMNILGLPVSSFIKGETATTSTGRTYDILNVEFVRNEVRDNINCMVFTGTIENTVIKEDIGEILVYLAPSMMYRPVYLECRSHNNLLVVTNRFKKYDNSIWFPKSITKQYYLIEENNKTLIKLEELSIHDDYEVNIDIPDTIFEINFPRNLRVIDLRKVSKN